MSVQSNYQPVQQRIAALEEELADLQTRVRHLEERQRDDEALKKFILDTINEDIRIKGSGGLLGELTRHVRER
jgi:predicted  nucleic acid-binding Zn-ribbon protein